MYMPKRIRIKPGDCTEVKIQTKVELPHGIFGAVVILLSLQMQDLGSENLAPVKPGL